MADYSVTAASVLPSAAARLSSQYAAGAAITIGQSVYLDAATSTIKLADANLSAAAATFFGIAVSTAAAAGQPIVVCLGDVSFTPGFTVAAGATVILSATAGGLAPIADLATGWYLNVVGVGIGSNKINFTPLAAGVATP